MTRRPGQSEDEPDGGRAAERLRAELESRFPGGVVPDQVDESPSGRDSALGADQKDGDTGSG